MAKVIYSRSGEFELPKNAVDWLRTHGVSEDCIKGYLLDAFPRHDPLLVQLVEKLKKDVSQFFILIWKLRISREINILLQKLMEKKE